MRFTIKLKLAIAFGFMIVLLIGSAVYGIISLSSLNDAIGNVIAGPAARLEKAQNLSSIPLRVVRAEMVAATTPPPSTGEEIEAAKAAAANTKQKSEANRKAKGDVALHYNLGFIQTIQ